MSKYFSDFPTTRYRFGDEVSTTLFQNISAYVDILDHIKSNGAFYTKQHIKQSERPDTLSFKLYGRTDFHWTFFLLNDDLRLNGWPINNSELLELSKRYYPNRVITTKEPIYNTILPGTVLTGAGASGTVIKRNIDLGQIFVDTPGVFFDNESLSYYDPIENGPANAVCYYSLPGHEAIHHYENGATGEWVDIDPYLQVSGANNIAINYLEQMIRVNERSKEIVVIKPNFINQVSGQFKLALQNVY